MAFVRWMLIPRIGYLDAAMMGLAVGFYEDFGWGVFIWLAAFMFAATVLEHRVLNK